MACGETPDHQVPKQIVDELLPILDDPYTRYSSIMYLLDFSLIIYIAKPSRHVSL